MNHGLSRGANLVLVISAPTHSPTTSSRMPGTERHLPCTRDSTQRFLEFRVGETKPKQVGASSVPEANNNTPAPLLANAAERAGSAPPGHPLLPGTQEEASRPRSPSPLACRPSSRLEGCRSTDCRGSERGPGEPKTRLLRPRTCPAGTPRGGPACPGRAGLEPVRPAVSGAPRTRLPRPRTCRAGMLRGGPASTGRAGLARSASRRGVTPRASCRGAPRTPPPAAGGARG